MLSVSSSPLPNFSVQNTSPNRTKSRSFRPPFIANSATAYKQRSSSSSSSSAFFPNSQRMTSSLYEILGIPMGASNQEIKSAYRRLARTCHPDVSALDRKDSSADEFMKVHAAYSTLSDPEKRAVYDRKLVVRKRPSMTVSYSAYRGGRSWETDQCW